MNLLLDAQQGNPFFLIFLIVLMFAFIYFFQVRPNKKRQKEFQALMDSLEVGNEVLLNGGLIGTITKLSKDNDLILVKISKDVVITSQKGFILNVLPSGTIESINSEGSKAKK